MKLRTPTYQCVRRVEEDEERLPFFVLLLQLASSTSVSFDFFLRNLSEAT